MKTFKKENKTKTNITLIPYFAIIKIAKRFMYGAKKYGENNWKLAKTEKEINEFRKAAARHFHQWLDGQDDEDHAFACITNIIMYTWYKK